MLEQQSREVVDLLKETVRLTALAAELGPPADRAAAAVGVRRSDLEPPPSAHDAHRQLLARVREVELQIHDLQSRVSASLGRSARGATAGSGPRSRPRSTFATAT